MLPSCVPVEFHDIIFTVLEPHYLLTLGGYGSHFVCVCVCLFPSYTLQLSFLDQIWYSNRS